MEFSFSPKRLVVAVAAALPLMASAADTPSTATARKGFAGYDHPNQYLVKPATTIADNMMPVMQHPAQDKETQQKLAELEKKTGKKPNVVVFLLDDVGWMDVGFNGGGVAVGNPTPDIDAVASQGLILTSAYSQPSSSPTRATILTGQYSIHHGILMPPMYGQPGGLQGLTTLPQLLHDQGYVTQAIGKWHMGENKESQPQNVGFDDFRGFNSVSDMYTEWRDVHVNPEVALSRTVLNTSSNYRSAKMTFMRCAAANNRPLPTLRRNIWKIWINAGWTMALSSSTRWRRAINHSSSTTALVAATSITTQMRNMRVALRHAPRMATAWWR